MDYLPIFLTIILTIVYFIYSKIHKLFLFFIPVFFICFFISIFASIDYVKGRARLNAMGLIKGLPHFDDESRLYWQRGGCIRFPAIDIPDMYANLYLKSLIKIFGYQRGAFTGYFPTKEEIKNFIKNTKFKESNFDLEEKEKGIIYKYT
ncbi:MAG TPA: hypothetical protein PLX69_03900 [Leptospiraceae bacterium]|nr:hypothetical protein [Leptospiraceae bacterium]